MLSYGAKLTGNGGELGLAVLGGTTDQLNGNGAIEVLGGSVPGNGERSASGNDFAGLGGVNGIEVGGLGKGRSGESQDSGNGETHAGGYQYKRLVVYKVVKVEHEGV